MDNNILKILEKFSRLSGLKLEVQAMNISAEFNVRFDALISLKIGALSYPFWVKFIPRSQTSSWDERQLSQSKFENIILLGHLSAHIKQKCRKNRMAFIDESGGYSIPINLGRSGDELDKDSPQETVLALKEKIVTSSSSMGQLLLYLSSSPYSMKASQRIVCDETGMAIGTVNKLLQNLNASKYVLNMRGGRRILDADRLLDLWVFEYERSMLPGIKSYKFSLGNENELKKLKVDARSLKAGYWSSAKAADILLNSEVPLNLLIYADKRSDVIRELKLRPDPEGAIEVRDKFWKFSWTQQSDSIVPIPLIYADLLMSRDPRDESIARKVRELWKQSLT